MKSYAEILITPKELRNYCILQKNIVLQKDNDVLVTGCVLDTQCEPIWGAVIIIQIICNDHISQEKQLGYAITNHEGKFAILIVRDEAINYRIDIYEPIIKV